MERGCDWLRPEVDFGRFFAKMDTRISHIPVHTSLCSRTRLWFPSKACLPHSESSKAGCGRRATPKARLPRGFAASALAFLECCHLVRRPGQPPWRWESPRRAPSTTIHVSEDLGDPLVSGDAPADPGKPSRTVPLSPTQIADFQSHEWTKMVVLAHLGWFVTW